MPRRRNLQGDVDKIVSAMKICKNPMEFRRLQCVYLGIMYPDMTARKIGETTLYSERQVKEIHMNYRKEGLERLADMRGGRYRQYMTLDEETEFLKPFEEESKSGKIAVANEIKIAYEAKLGKEVAESTIYRSDMVFAKLFRTKDT